MAESESIDNLIFKCRNELIEALSKFKPNSVDYSVDYTCDNLHKYLGVIDFITITFTEQFNRLSFEDRVSYFLQIRCLTDLYSSIREHGRLEDMRRWINSIEEKENKKI